LPPLPLLLLSHVLELDALTLKTLAEAHQLKHFACLQLLLEIQLLDHFRQRLFERVAHYCLQNWLHLHVEVK